MCNMEGLTDKEIIRLCNLRIQCKEWLEIFQGWVKDGNIEQLDNLEDKLSNIYHDSSFWDEKGRRIK